MTQVVDAFDGDDPFDIHITLGYQHTWHNANIRRETSIGQPGLTTGGYKADTMNVAAFSETTSRLNTRIDAGIYKDIGLYLRLPIILSNSRELKGLSGSENVQGVVLAGAPGEQLFTLPFSSPNRSGIDYFAVGIDANVFNQYRDRTKPTWLVGIEGRFNVSEPMHACNSKPAAGQVQCADPSDVNRNGMAGDYSSAGYQLEGNSAGNRKPGVSRGVTGLEFHTLLSHRIKYIEPYGGFRAIFEFPTGSSDFGQTNLQGSLVNHPPLEGWVIIGLQVIPWENREAFQRVTFDGRIQGAYRSEGRDYSPLFDALGSSSALSIRRPNYSDYRYSGDPAYAGKSVVDPTSQKVYFTGITDVQQHGKFGAFGSVTWQAGEYIKFQLGMGYTYIQSHFITMDQPCNPDFKNDPGRSGPCHSASQTSTAVGTATGIPNPNYRPQINHVGSRFKVDDSTMIDLWVNGVVMF
ncbi:MAG: hypothetical protein HY898_09860 [Deltaproteobacteria bacterium]|nr:hypothetical protein [Deltaproteobacteria bacterium]